MLDNRNSIQIKNKKYFHGTVEENMLLLIHCTFIFVIGREQHFKARFLFLRYYSLFTQVEFIFIYFLSLQHTQVHCQVHLHQQVVCLSQ